MQNAHADDFMVAPDEAPMCYPTEGRSLRSWCLYTPNDPMQYKGTSTRVLHCNFNGYIADVTGFEELTRCSCD